MSRSPANYLRHIIDETTYLVEASEQLSKDEFLQDETIKRAFVRSLEIIGEATKNLPDDFRTRHDHVNWKPIAGLRDRLIHGYFGVDYEIVWDIVVSKIPNLRSAVRELLESQE